MSVSLSVLIKTPPSLMLFVLFCPPVRNWIWEAGDLHQTGQTGGGMFTVDLDFFTGAYFLIASNITHTDTEFTFNP